MAGAQLKSISIRNGMGGTLVHMVYVTCIVDAKQYVHVLDMGL